MKPVASEPQRCRHCPTDERGVVWPEGRCELALGHAGDHHWHDAASGMTVYEKVLAVLEGRLVPHRVRDEVGDGD